MEDFQAASKQRHRDVERLISTQGYVAAMHLGGTVVECLLKAILCDFLPPNAQGIKEWKTKANNPGHAIKRPGHKYHEIYGAHQPFRDLVRGTVEVTQWLQDVEDPLGNFIEMRYLGLEPDHSDVEAAYQRWLPSYTNVVSWLQQQKKL